MYTFEWVQSLGIFSSHIRRSTTYRADYFLSLNNAFWTLLLIVDKCLKFNHAHRRCIKHIRTQSSIYSSLLFQPRLVPAWTRRRRSNLIMPIALQSQTSMRQFDKRKWQVRMERSLAALISEQRRRRDDKQIHTPPTMARGEHLQASVWFTSSGRRARRTRTEQMSLFFSDWSSFIFENRKFTLGLLTRLFSFSHSLVSLLSLVLSSSLVNENDSLIYAQV